MTFPAPNQMFVDRYRLDAVLGEGGFATVFRATDIGSERVVAIKILKPESGSYAPDIESRFTREVRVIAQLRDEHTVTLHDHGRSAQGLLYMVFEYLPGRDLSAVLAAERQLAPSIVIHILIQILQSLAEAHSKGMLHRDIKPQNIRVFEYMGDPYRVKVLDFGIARRAQRAQAETAITQAGQLVGTPRYMSPEQLSEEPLSPASDIYSLGLVAVEMLSGSASLQGNRWADQFDRLVTGHVFSIDEYERVGPGLRSVVQRMTARNASDRYSSAEAVLWALNSLTQRDSYEGPLATRPSEPPQPAIAAPTLRERRPRESTPRTAHPTVAHEASSALPRPVLAGIVILAVGAMAATLWLGMTHREEDARTERQRSLMAMQQNRSSNRAVDKTREIGSTAVRAVTEPDAEREPEEGPAPVVGGSEGCGSEPPTIEHGQISWVDGLERTTLPAHLPRKYDSNRKYPVVVLFHQDGRTGDEILRQTSFAPLADAEGFIVVSPTYPGNNLVVWRQPTDVDFVRDLVQRIGREVCMDPERVYAVGHGAGGSIVEYLACEPWIAGVATNGFRSEYPDFFGCADRRPKPSIHLTPMDTRRMPIEGGSARCKISGTRISLKANEEKWRRLNSCSAVRTMSSEEPNGTCYEYSGCEEPFVTCHIDGGYGWPGSRMVEHDLFGDCGDIVRDFPATETIWEFFKALSG